VFLHKFPCNQTNDFGTVDNNTLSNARHLSAILNSISFSFVHTDFGGQCTLVQSATFCQTNYICPYSVSPSVTSRRTAKMVRDRPMVTIGKLTIWLLRGPTFNTLQSFRLPPRLAPHNPKSYQASAAMNNFPTFLLL